VRVIIVPRKDVAADALFLGLSSETRKLAGNGVLGSQRPRGSEWMVGNPEATLQLVKHLDIAH